jgi:hypothetical protein
MAAKAEAEDIAFKLQRGFILPKLDEQLSAGLTSIIDEVMTCAVEGTLEQQAKPTMKEIKVLFIKSIETLLDKKVLPPIDEKFNPPVVEEPEEAVEVDGENEEVAEKS